MNSQADVTIVVPGTDWRKWKHTYASEARPMRSIATAFGRPPLLFEGWSGGNSREARTRAAAELVKFIKLHIQKARGVNLVGFSHGGNVAALATHSLAPLHMDTLVTIATPVLPDYQPAAVARHIHIYNPHDVMQVWGGERFTLPGIGSVGPAGRVFPHAANVAVSIRSGTRHQRHGNLLWDHRTWALLNETRTPTAFHRLA